MSAAALAPHAVLLAALVAVTVLVLREGHRTRHHPTHGRTRPHHRHTGTAHDDTAAITRHDKERPMYPTLFTNPGVKQFAEEVDAERTRQLAKFGEQHHPDIEPRDIPAVTHPYYAQRADIWKQVNSERATPSNSGRCLAHCADKDGELHTHTAWDGVLLEEVYEALAEPDPAKLRTELVQIAAVCAAWVHDLDSRTAPTTPAV